MFTRRKFLKRLGVGVAALVVGNNLPLEKLAGETRQTHPGPFDLWEETQRWPLSTLPPLDAFSSTTTDPRVHDMVLDACIGKARANAFRCGGIEAVNEYDGVG
jgi:hypothetical protein